MILSVRLSSGTCDEFQNMAAATKPSYRLLPSSMAGSAEEGKHEMPETCFRFTQKDWCLISKTFLKTYLFLLSEHLAENSRGYSKVLCWHFQTTCAVAGHKWHCGSRPFTGRHHSLVSGSRVQSSKGKVWHVCAFVLGGNHFCLIFILGGKTKQNKQTNKNSRQLQILWHNMKVPGRSSAAPTRWGWDLVSTQLSLLPSSVCWVHLSHSPAAFFT